MFDGSIKENVSYGDNGADKPNEEKIKECWDLGRI